MIVFEALWKRASNPVIRNSIIYTTASTLNAAIPFFLLPVLTKFLTPAEYGIVAIFMACNSVFILLIGLEQSSFISVNFFNATDLKGVTSSVVTISIGVFVLSFVSLAIFSDFFANLIDLPSKWILLACIIALLQSISQVNLTIWQLENKAIKYGLFQVANSVVNYFISIILIWNFDLDETGRILGIAATAVLFGIANFIIITKKKLLSFHFNTTYIRQSLKYSVPLIPHGTATWVNTSMDRILINSFIGSSATGVFAISYQIAMIIGMVSSSFNRAFIPFIFKVLTGNSVEGKKKLIKYTYLYYLALIVFSLLLYLVSPIIIDLIIDKKYQNVEQYLFWLMVGFMADGMYCGVINFIYYSRKTAYVSVVTFSSCLLHFALSYALIPIYGPIAAAYSTAVSYCFAFILSWLISLKVYPMPWFSFKS